MNLLKLSRNPSPYVLPVIPRPLPSEIEEGEHYVIADLMNLAPGSSSPTQTFETEVVGRELVINIRQKQPSLAREDFDPAPKHLRGLIGVVVSRVFLLQKRILVLPPKRSIREGGCLNGEKRLERGWKILSLRLSQYLAAPLLAKRKNRRTRWLTSLITLAHESANGAPASRERLMLPSRWLVYVGLRRGFGWAGNSCCGLA